MSHRPPRRGLAAAIAALAVVVLGAPPLVVGAARQARGPFDDDPPAAADAAAAEPGEGAAAGVGRAGAAAPGPAARPWPPPPDERADPVLARLDDGPALPVADEPEPQVSRPEVDAEGLEPPALDLDVLEGGRPDVVIEGRGWGHGVGLSQHGARAMARHGHDRRAILAHYYPGTAFTPVGTGHELRVGLTRADADEALPAELRVTSRRAWEDGAVFAALDGGERAPLRPGEPVELRADGDHVVVDLGGEPLRGREARLDWDPRAAAGPALAFPDLADRVPATRWGRLHVSARGGELRPVLEIGVERYLRGLAEVPSSWPAAALRAQAVAARTYALRAAAEGLQPACACHLGPTAHDQVFRGWGAERGAGAWLAAVEHTAGQAVTRGGGLVWAYYSSSHGGRSERTVDSFAFDSDDGQWPSVDDPWSLDPAAGNPRASWDVAVEHDDFVAALGMPLLAVLEVETVVRTAGGSPHTLRITGLLPTGLPLATMWAGGDGRGAAAWLRRELGGQVLPSQQLTGLRVQG